MKKPVYIGIGELEDPLPDHPQLTRFRIFAGPCPDCQCNGRKLLPAKESLQLCCDRCGNLMQTNIPVAEYSEVTYIYWCNSSKFASDVVELSCEEAAAVDELLSQFPLEYEAPHWAVPVVAGRCFRSESCINFDCIYLIRSQ